MKRQDILYYAWQC